MLRLIFAFIIFIHGLIHLMGFAKAFNYGNISQLTKDISKPSGIVWFITAILFIVLGLMFLMKKDLWWVVGLIAVLISQSLIFTTWTDAKFGIIANVIILIASIFSYGSWQFEKNYKNDVNVAKKNLLAQKVKLVTEKDIAHLPIPVQNYLRYVGVINKPVVQEYKIVFEGEMREKGKEWFTFTSEQYNFTKEPTRLFFMKAKMFGLTVQGYHAYKNGEASMQVKLFGLFPIVNTKEDILDKAETVTIFNDMCLLAPASLIDERIKWQPIDNFSAKGTLTVNGNVISAILYFNDQGQLVNFISDDRYAIANKKQYRFSTPVSNYQNFNGYNLPEFGEAIWHYPDGEFVYGKFHLKEIHYNGK